jgi:hypothetical protein
MKLEYFPVLLIIPFSVQEHAGRRLTDDNSEESIPLGDVIELLNQLAIFFGQKGLKKNFSGCQSLPENNFAKVEKWQKN